MTDFAARLWAALKDPVELPCWCVLAMAGLLIWNSFGRLPVWLWLSSAVLGLVVWRFVLRDRTHAG